MFTALTTYLVFATLIALGHLRDFFGKLTGKSRYVSIKPPEVRAFALTLAIPSIR